MVQHRFGSLALLVLASSSSLSCSGAKDADTATAAAPESAVDAGAGQVVLPERSNEREEARTSPDNDAGSDSIEIRGRFLFASGAPAPGVQLLYLSPERNSLEEFKSAADGTFSVAGDPIDDNPNLIAQLGGYAPFQWEWFGTKPGQVIDVGDVVLDRGGTVLARIVDRDGNVLTEGWTVYAERHLNRPDGGDDDSQVGNHRPQPDGKFRLEQVPSGTMELKAYSELAGWIEGAAVEVREGEVLEAELRYMGSDTSKRITVTVFLDRFYFPDGDPAIHLSGLGLEPRTARKIEGSAQSFSFDDLPDGTFRLEIDDPRYLPWSMDGVAPGSAVDAQLRGSCSLVLHIQDADVEIHDYRARLRFRHVTFSPDEFDLFEGGAKPAADGVIDGIVPGDFTLIVSALGSAPSEVLIDALAPSEHREVVVHLDRGGAIVGTLEHADGTAVPGTEVLLVRPDERLTSGGEDPGFAELEDEQNALRTETDELGRFQFREVAAGRYELRSRRSSLMSASATVEVVTGQKAQPVLRFPAESFLSGRMLGPPGCSFEDLRVGLEPQEPAGSGTPEGDLSFFVTGFSASGWESADLGRDGSFRIGPVRPGAYVVLLQLPDVRLDLGPQASTIMPGSVRKAGEIELRGGENSGLTFDVAASFPGKLLVHVRGENASLSGALVTVLGRKGEEMYSGLGALGKDGEVAIAPLFPAEYGVAVQAEDRSWCSFAPTTQLLEAGGSVRCDLEIVRVPGKLRVTDSADGEPFSGRQVLLVPRPPIEWFPVGPLAPLSTDREGVVEATLVPGEYWVVDGGGGMFALANEANRVALRWTSGGPEPGTVAIPRVEASDFGDTGYVGVDR